MPREISLLTGCTGMLGEFLLVELIERKTPLAVVVRPKGELTASQRIDQVLRRFNLPTSEHLDNLVVLEGDVTRPLLGLAESDISWLSHNVLQCIHNAASVKFQRGPRTGEPWTSNVDGTENVLQVLEKLQVDRLMYMSTAYVCGCRQGTIFEDELDLDQDFRNDYEQSKFLAEGLVRRRFPGLLTVMRPAVVVGDSNTGQIVGYHGIYKVFQFTWLLSRQSRRDQDGMWNRQVRLRMNGLERRNLVPVDWLVAIVARILERPELQGATYHLAPEFPTTTLEIDAALAAYFRYRGVEFVGQRANVPNASSGPDEIAYYEAMRLFEDYFLTEPLFDTTNVRSRFEDLPMPRVDHGVLLRLIDFAVKDRWGKRARSSSRQAVKRHAGLPRTEQIS